MKNYPVLITELGDLPLTLDEVKANLGDTVSDDDSVLTEHLTDAVAYCEGRCNRVFTVGSTVEFYAPCLATYIDLPKQLQEVVSVQYYDTDNELMTIAPADYAVIKSSFSSAWVEFFGTLPTTFNRKNPVVITLESGDCPGNVKSAIHLYIEGMYDGGLKDNMPNINNLLATANNPFI